MARKTLWVVAVLVCASWTAAAPQGAAPTETYGGQPIEQWVERLGGKDPAESKEARAALIEIGQPAVPALMAVVEKGGAGTADALCILGSTKETARDAVPRLREIAEAQKWPPEAWIPFYRAIAENKDEQQQIRTLAVQEFKKMGEPAIPVLREMMLSGDDVIRHWARYMAVEILQRQAGDARTRFFAELIERDPFAPDVPDYLSAVTGYVNSGRTHPLREKVKAIYRGRLREKPDPLLARTLALLIQNQLRNTEIEWETHTDSSKGRSARECPSDSFATLAEVLEYGMRHSEVGSDLWREFGTGLARLRLLQGDWQGLNATLTTLGQTPIPETDRPWLCGPPEDWSEDVGKSWGPADPAMRSGDCSFVVRMEKGGGEGVAGFHVLVQPAPPPPSNDGGSRTSFRTGFRRSTFGTPQPFGGGDTFGCGGNDRPKSRYAVSDASGEVRFDKLPAGVMKLVILLPTANFPEAARDWDLYAEVEPGKFERPSRRPVPDTPGPHNPKFVVELQPGKTVRYPLLVVRPRYDLNVENGGDVNADRFALRWEGLKTQAGKKVEYEMEMALTRPGWAPGGPEYMPVVRSAKVATSDTTWPVADKGVEGMRLCPGNLYLFQVQARDESGTVLARWGQTWVWAPWTHRESSPPVNPDGAGLELPIPDDLYFRWSRQHNGEEENFPQWAARWLRENPQAFECEYVRVIQAWLAWHDEKIDDARKQLTDLVKQLPKGNVAQATAIWLLGEIEAEAKPPRRLKFVAVEDLDPARLDALAAKPGNPR